MERSFGKELSKVWLLVGANNQRGTETQFTAHREPGLPTATWMSLETHHRCAVRWLQFKKTGSLTLTSSDTRSVSYYSSLLYLFIYLKIFIHLLLERREGRKKKRERNFYVREKYQLVASGMCPSRVPHPQPRHVPWPEWNWWAFALQDDAQPTEPRQSGLFAFF